LPSRNGRKNSKDHILIRQKTQIPTAYQYQSHQETSRAASTLFSISADNAIFWTSKKRAAH